MISLLWDAIAERNSLAHVFDFFTNGLDESGWMVGGREERFRTEEEAGEHSRSLKACSYSIAVVFGPIEGPPIWVSRVARLALRQ